VRTCESCSRKTPDYKRTCDRCIKGQEATRLWVRAFMRRIKAKRAAKRRRLKAKRKVLNVAN
jgi:hypothetical protein